MANPPDGLPVYRVLTGPDDSAFCRRVSEALDLGYRLHEGPSVTFDGERVIVAQAVVWDVEGLNTKEGRCTAPALLRRAGYFTIVMRSAAGGASGEPAEEWAVRYCSRAARSSSPTRSSAPWPSVVKPSPPPARKLFVATR